MKKLCFFLLLCAGLLLAGCGDQSSAETTEAVEDAAAAETASAVTGDMVDLTQLSSTMVYSEVYNMMTTPEDYVGKTVKMAGTLTTYEDVMSEKIYYACLIADATACCSQGMEFVWKDHGPEDYPEEGTELVVEGVFETYKEGGLTYCQLNNAEVTIV